MAFDNENKLDGLKDFRGSRGVAKRRITFHDQPLERHGLPLGAVFSEEGRSMLNALL